jgi:predicted ATPase
MTLQEMIKSLDELSVEEQASLFEEQEKTIDNHGETFWEMTLRFRERMEREGIEFTDEDFADLRDRSPGREVLL